MRTIVYISAFAMVVAVALVTVGQLDGTPSAQAGNPRQCWVGLVAYEMQTDDLDSVVTCSDPAAPDIQDWSCDFSEGFPVPCDPVDLTSPEFVDCAVNGVNIDCTGGPDGPPSYTCVPSGDSINCGALDGPSIDCQPETVGFECQVLDGAGDFRCEPDGTFYRCETFAPVFYLFGDTDCGGAVNIGDAINVSRTLVDLNVNQQPECPGLEEQLTVGDDKIQWADFNCSGEINIGDAIVLARSLVDLPVNVGVGCPELGVNVEVG